MFKLRTTKSFVYSHKLKNIIKKIRTGTVPFSGKPPRSKQKTHPIIMRLLMLILPMEFEMEEG
jgi:hypothetical protein